MEFKMKRIDFSSKNSRNRYALFLSKDEMSKDVNYSEQRWKLCQKTQPPSLGSKQLPWLCPFTSCKPLGRGWGWGELPEPLWCDLFLCFVLSLYKMGIIMSSSSCWLSDFTSSYLPFNSLHSRHTVLPVPQPLTPTQALPKGLCTPSSPFWKCSSPFQKCWATEWLCGSFPQKGQA